MSDCAAPPTTKPP